MRTTLILFILLTVFSVHTFAQGFPHIVLEGHVLKVNSVAFSPDGTMLASGNDEDAVLLWDVTTGELLKAFEGNPQGVDSVAFSPDGSTLASAGEDTVRLWDIATGRLKDTLTLPISLTGGRRIAYTRVAFSPDGDILVSGIYRKTLFLWLNTRLFPETFEGHTDDITSLAFSPDGSILASADEDGMIRLWDIDVELDTGPILWDLETGQQSLTHGKKLITRNAS